MILNPNQSVENLKGDLGGSVEGAFLNVGTPGTGSLASFLVTCPAVAAMTQADYFIYTLPSGNTVAVWFDIDAAGTAPTGALYVAATTQIEVDVVTGDTAAQVAGKAFAAIDLVAAAKVNMTITNPGAGADISLVSTLLGVIAAPVPKNADDSGAGSVIASTVVAGSAATSQNKYIVIRNAADASFYVWLNINGEGVDPAPGGTGQVATIAAADNAAAVLTAMNTAINLLADAQSQNEGSGLLISAKVEDEIIDTTAGNTGFTVSIRSQGSTERFAPGMSPDSISNNPAAF